MTGLEVRRIAYGLRDARCLVLSEVTGLYADGLADQARMAEDVVLHIDAAIRQADRLLWTIWSGGIE